MRKNRTVTPSRRNTNTQTERLALFYFMRQCGLCMQLFDRLQKRANFLKPAAGAMSEQRGQSPGASNGAFRNLYTNLIGGISSALPARRIAASVLEQLQLRNDIHQMPAACSHRALHFEHTAGPEH
jgi:hypothetical protein